MSTTEYFAIENGCHARRATIIEAIEFCASNPTRTWEKATKVSSDAVIDTYYGPGISMQTGVIA